MKRLIISAFCAIGCFGWHNGLRAEDFCISLGYGVDGYEFRIETQNFKETKTLASGLCREDTFFVSYFKSPISKRKMSVGIHFRGRFFQLTADRYIEIRSSFVQDRFLIINRSHASCMLDRSGVENNTFYAIGKVMDVALSETVVGMPLGESKILEDSEDDVSEDDNLLTQLYKSNALQFMDDEKRKDVHDLMLKVFQKDIPEPQKRKTDGCMSCSIF